MYCNVLELLKERAAAYPTKIAFRDIENEISFGELNEIATAIGGFICDIISDTDPVVFFVEKSIPAVCGMFGTVYAGGCYAFIDIRQPLERVLSIFDTLKSKVIFTDEEHYDNIKEILEDDIKIIKIDELYIAIKAKIFAENFEIQMVAYREQLKKIDERFCDTNPLYINFTSGSTGTPKGVVVSHRSVLDFIEQFVRLFGISQQDIIANQAPFDFDVSVKDIYSGLYSGAEVCLIPRKFFSKPIQLMDYLADINPTVLIWAVSALCMLSIMKCLEYKVPDTVRIIMFSGEVMPIKHYIKLKKYFPNTVFVNLYGPTEITCNCTYHIVNEDDVQQGVIPIGIPFYNERVFLLNEQDQLLTEVGCMGEICVSGTSVSLGYYGYSDKSNEKFVQNPLNSRYREIIYRTGDLAKYNKNKELVFVSRKDLQIKHMGHRIELSEIEANVMLNAEVESACCCYDDEHKKIILFYKGTIDAKDLLLFVRKKIPSYMIPNCTITTDEIPLNKNGKTDRHRLMEQYRRQENE